MADLPHFDLPFRYVGTAPVVNEQDSIDDIVACVYVVALTEPGERDELPDFGLTDQTHTQLPLNRHAIAAQISEWEPRVQLLVDTVPDLLDVTLAQADIIVETPS